MVIPIVFLYLMVISSHFPLLNWLEVVNNKVYSSLKITPLFMLIIRLSHKLSPFLFVNIILHEIKYDFILLNYTFTIICNLSGISLILFEQNSEGFAVKTFFYELLNMISRKFSPIKSFCNDWKMSQLVGAKSSEYGWSFYFYFPPTPLCYSYFTQTWERFFLLAGVVRVLLFLGE